MSEDGAPLLAVRELSKSYGRRRALDGVSFTVRPGEVLGLISPNGAGKTTLFECLAGVLPADGGKVRGIDGRLLAPAERRAAMFYVPDGIAPWPDQPAGRVLLFFRDLWGVPAARGSAAIDSFRLRPLLGGAVHSLSKGERKRFLTALGLRVRGLRGEGGVGVVTPPGRPMRDGTRSAGPNGP